MAVSRPLARALASSLVYLLLGAGLGCSREDVSSPVETLEADPSTEPGLEPSSGDGPEPPPAADPPPPPAPLLGDAVSEPLGQHVESRYPASLETVLERRFLRVLTSHNAFDFFLQQGHRGGYQFELVKEFTRFLNERHRGGRGDLAIQFELIPVDDDQLIPLLLGGAGDLIAARLTITSDRAARVAFSHPYLQVDELLVAHDRSPAITALEDLSGQQVAVRASSSFASSLAELNRHLVAGERAPVDVVHVDEALETERILSLVAARRFPFSVADSVVAELAAEIHPSLRVIDGLALRRGGQIAWATLPEAEALQAEMNAFLKGFEQGTLRGNLALRRYFEDEHAFVKRVAGEEGDVVASVSPYDALFREHAPKLGIDWRLAASMAYQESRFDPLARNRWGAVGLMQIKPQTAREPYVDIPEIEGVKNVGNNVRAGLTYLSWIKSRYFDEEPDMRERDRLRMALAAYNAGPRTVLRARARAREQGLDPDRWFRNVEVVMLGMRKAEPVKYVSEINQRYLGYVLLGVE